MLRAALRAGLAAALAGAAPGAAAEVRVVDDAGRELVLAAAARRIVSLAPHATEMLFAVGAGDRVVGTAAHTDHPAAARAIPRVGDSALIDLERIVSLKPDLIVVWQHGNSERHLAKVRALGIPVYHDRPRRLADIPRTLERLGRLAGSEPGAARAARAFSERLAALERRYASRPVVDVFFQVWERPLMTFGGAQIVSDVIRACGGRNVFAGEALLAPTVDVEAVVRAAPEVVVRTGPPGEAARDFEPWRRLPAFPPTARGNLLTLETETLGRPAPRILEGAEALCEALEAARARR